MPPSLLIPLPERLDLDGAVAFGNSLNAQQTTGVMLFDCASLAYVEPFGMLYAAQVIRQYQARVGCQIAPVHQDLAVAAGYAAHMGFFQACGFPIGKQPGQAKGNARYLPITYESVTALRGSSSYRVDVDQIGEQIAARLLQKPGKALAHAVVYAACERYSSLFPD